MEVLTIDTYFKVLENCTLEAFESLKLKDFYPKDGTKAVWDVSSLLITKGDGLPTERDKEIFRKAYIRDNLTVTFLKTIERHCKDFESKYLMSRSYFYKKCYESLMVKTTESELWNKPDFGFNIDAEPDVLNFIWNMRKNIENRSIEEKTEYVQWTLNDYYKHYIETSRFGFTIYLTYKNNQFDELSKRLNETKKRYDYIFNKLNDSQRIEFKNDFCDQLAKLKTKQTESKNIEIIQTLFLKINDEYNHYHRNSKLQIDEYKNAIIGDFKMICKRKNDNYTLNPFYYYSQIRSFIKGKNDFVKANPNLISNLKEILLFNSFLESILMESFMIFKSSYDYNIDEVHFINDFHHSKFILAEYLTEIKKFAHSINIELQNSEFQNSILLKNYYVSNFKSLKVFLSSTLCINIDKSPLKPEFDEVLTELENSFDISEIQILMKSNVQPEIEQPETKPLNLVNTLTEKKESVFSVLEWATIFYYADSCKYFNQKNMTEKQSFFIEKHNIKTSKLSFKNKFYEAKNNINNTNNYSIDKLNLIKPFIIENYFKGVAKLENDIEYLKNEAQYNTD